MNYEAQHKFHIPVMGLAFTIDLPAKVARFGIASVVSFVEDLDRPHMFIAELFLCLTYLQEELQNEAAPDAKRKKYYEGFCKNLLTGISYCRSLASIAADNRPAFDRSLAKAETVIAAMLAEIELAYAGENKLAGNLFAV